MMIHPILSPHLVGSSVSPLPVFPLSEAYPAEPRPRHAYTYITGTRAVMGMGSHGWRGGKKGQKRLLKDTWRLDPSLHSLNLHYTIHPLPLTLIYPFHLAFIYPFPLTFIYPFHLTFICPLHFPLIYSFHLALIYPSVNCKGDDKE